MTSGPTVQQPGSAAPDPGNETAAARLERWQKAGGAEMTHQSAWGGIDVPFALMTDIKREFDPGNLLNPGRFVYLEPPG